VLGVEAVANRQVSRLKREPGEAFADFSAGYLQIGKAGCRRIERGMKAQ
jgi:hypothetical protein